ncbi:MAG: succinyl-CoA--benzylsuccinate CoA-transferase [Deltaproteobacteria bacterium]|jgi:crotonobetainyl-CoA:carnitine CoA-transferase CaiB-like acyl-CoA transferase|nr:succinyl-CoA--benzylsuccinate CoA-transferase [Deltaproteobacteria bacterium]
MATGPSGALTGRRVIELADAKGAYCGKLLADLGADVVLLEPPLGDQGRSRPPRVGGSSGREESLSFLYLNTSKRGATLDLQKEEGRALFARLASGADLVIEALAPGTLEGLGLGWESLRRANPRLVLTSITGFGQTGPHRGFQSSDLVASAMSGAMHVTGDEEDPPVRLAGHQAHVAAASVAAASSLIALLASSQSGEGQHVDISVQEVVASLSHICGVGKWLDDGIIPKRRGTGLFASVPSGAYACRDGSVYLMVNRPLHWAALARWVHEVTGNEEILDPMFDGPSSNRLPYRELLDLFISDLMTQLSVEEAYREGQGRHIAVTPVQPAAGVTEDPHLAARGFFEEIDHPTAGRITYPGAPYRHSRTPWRMHRPAPLLGQHNREVYCDELGLSEAALRALQEGGVI